MELYHTSQLSRGHPSSALCERYLKRLPLAQEQRRELLNRVSGSDGADAHSAMAALHHALAGHPAENDNPASTSIRRRVDIACGTPQADTGTTITKDLQGRVRLVTTPPLNRTSMVPRKWPPKVTFWPFGSIGRHRSWDRGDADDFRRDETGAHSDSPDPRGRWQRIGTLRRIILGVLVSVQTIVATDFMTAVLPYHGGQPLEITILILFAILFGWVSAGFWTALTGFLLLLKGGDHYAISRSVPGKVWIDPQARTAIVMPICNENVRRVFAGLRATYESLSQAGELQHFDFFILSDSNDPDIRIAEVAAWLEMCRAVKGFGHVFYRWRQHRIKRKSGNIADFCRRWGKNYRYMVVLDADSVMSGECLATLVRLMEANPDTGIIQTAPRAAGRETVYARIQQFANRVYGPLFTAGLHFWQLGESHYWGHNAIMRVAPFIRHCALGRLPGRGTLSGEILSHDFVEAALMRRAGWAVWLAYDLPGSYEEMPPNLVDELKRDRRWCHGNLINSRLFLAEGLHAAHRAIFMTGVMAYLSAPLWFLSLTLSTVLLAIHTLIAPQYFVRPHQLFPLWPEWHIEWAIGLVSATAALLFLPKIFSVILIGLQGAKRFGGSLRLALSMLMELCFSVLLAPIRMLFHTQFVTTALIGLSVQWRSPPRDDAETAWGEALRRHGVHTLLGIGWAAVVYWLNPSFLWWLLPVVGALVLSIPLSVYSSRVSFGRRLRKARMFLIPEETWPPRELRWTRRTYRRAAALPGFVEAVVDPLTNALACASGVTRLRQPAAIRDARIRLGEYALVRGPDALTARQRAALLSDPLALAQLHFRVWTAANAHPIWIKAQAPEISDCRIIQFPVRRS